jgi:hypothetical protein
LLYQFKLIDRTYDKEKENTETGWGYLKERDRLEYLGIDGGIVLTFTLQTEYIMA